MVGRTKIADLQSILPDLSRYVLSSDVRETAAALKVYRGWIRIRRWWRAIWLGRIGGGYLAVRSLLLPEVSKSRACILCSTRFSGSCKVECVRQETGGGRAHITTSSAALVVLCFIPVSGFIFFFCHIHPTIHKLVQQPIVPVSPVKSVF